MMASKIIKQRRLRRVDWLTKLVTLSARAALFYHRIKVDGAENLPVDGPYLLLPKHRAYRDILVEGVVLYRLSRRHGNYIMKVGLYGVLEWLGGIKIVRPKDIRRIKGREARKEHIRWARERNQETLDYVSWLYEHGELVVSHPEGMRYQETMGPLQREVIDHLMVTEERLGITIPVVPIGLKYDSFSRPGANLYFRIGKPMYSSSFDGAESLIAEINVQIRALSGIGADPRGGIPVAATT
jgi:1-acyl-sn-glycerol-3-phosphate acyltransferase